MKYPVNSRIFVESGNNEKLPGRYLGEVDLYYTSDGISETKPAGDSYRLLPQNPKLQLDTGEVVYGCQVWWGPLKEEPVPAVN